MLKDKRHAFLLVMCAFNFSKEIEGALCFHFRQNFLRMIDVLISDRPKKEETITSINSCRDEVLKKRMYFPHLFNYDSSSSSNQ